MKTRDLAGKKRRKTPTASAKQTQRPQSHGIVFSISRLQRLQLPLSNIPRDLRAMVQSCSLYPDFKDFNCLCQTHPETSEPWCSPALYIQTSKTSTASVKHTQRPQSNGAVLLSISRLQRLQLPLSNTPRDLRAMVQSCSLYPDFKDFNCLCQTHPETSEPWCSPALYIQTSKTSTASVKHTQRPQSHGAVLLSISRLQRLQLPLSNTPRDLRAMVQSCSLYPNLKCLCQTHPDNSESPCSPALYIQTSSANVKQTQKPQSNGVVLLSISNLNCLYQNTQRPQSHYAVLQSVLRPQLSMSNRHRDLRVIM